VGQDEESILWEQPQLIAEPEEVKKDTAALDKVE